MKFGKEFPSCPIIVILILKMIIAMSTIVWTVSSCETWFVFNLLRFCWTSKICCFPNYVWDFFGWVLPWRMIFLRLVKRVIRSLSRCPLQCFPLVPPEMSQLQQSIFSPILLNVFIQHQVSRVLEIKLQYTRLIKVDKYNIPSDAA